jgi:hypothetical protein
MFSFRDCWAHAHDAEQDTFMTLVAMYIEADPKYRRLTWLREWQAFWLEVAGRQGNGCSDLAADDHLPDEARVEEFRAFLRDYQSWCVAIGSALEHVTGVDAKRLLRFARTVDAVLIGDTSHPAVHRQVPPAGGVETAPV